MLEFFGGKAIVLYTVLSYYTVLYTYTFIQIYIVDIYEISYSVLHTRTDLIWSSRKVYQN